MYLKQEHYRTLSSLNPLAGFLQISEITYIKCYMYILYIFGLLLNVRMISPTRPEAQFIVSDWGMKSPMASGCRTGPPAYVALRTGTTDNSDAIAGFILQSGTKNTATGYAPFGDN
jgi:hypothetical protein